MQARWTGHLLRPASLPPSLGARSTQPGTPDDEVQLRAQCGPGSLNTNHRPQGVPRRGPRGPWRVSEAQQGHTRGQCRAPCSLGLAGGRGTLRTRMRPLVPPLGGSAAAVPRLLRVRGMPAGVRHPASDGGTQHPQGQRRARGLSSAPGSLGTSSPERKGGHQQRQRLGKPPSQAAGLLSPQGRAARGLGRSLPGGPHCHTGHPARSLWEREGSRQSLLQPALPEHETCK